MKNQPFRRRFFYALNGVQAAFRNEASFRFQCIAAVCAVAALAFFEAPAVWWALFLITIGGVLSAELFNTALEALIDRLHPEQHPLIKIAKDCAAGAVLVLSGFSVVIFILFLIEQDFFN